MPEFLAMKTRQVKFLHTQFSYNARVLGRLGEAEVSLKHLGGQVMACEHKLDFLIGKSAVRRLPAVSAAVQDKVGLVALKERVEEGYAKLAALAAEAAGCVFELHTRYARPLFPVACLPFRHVHSLLEVYVPSPLRSTLSLPR